MTANRRIEENEIELSIELPSITDVVGVREILQAYSNKEYQKVVDLFEKSGSDIDEVIKENKTLNIRSHICFMVGQAYKMLGDPKSQHYLSLGIKEFELPFNRNDLIENFYAKLLKAQLHLARNEGGDNEVAEILLNSGHEDLVECSSREFRHAAELFDFLAINLSYNEATKDKSNHYYYISFELCLEYVDRKGKNSDAIVPQLKKLLDKIENNNIFELQYEKNPDDLKRIKNYIIKAIDLLPEKDKIDWARKAVNPDTNIGKVVGAQRYADRFGGIFKSDKTSTTKHFDKIIKKLEGKFPEDQHTLRG